MFDFVRFQSTALTIIGTIILTAVSIGAAVGPARQVETAPHHYLAAVDSSAKFA